jgi:hypothetical protein
MGKTLALLAIALCCASSLAAPDSRAINEPLSIQRQIFGSGEQGAAGSQQAEPVMTMASGMCRSTCLVTRLQQRYGPALSCEMQGQAMRRLCDYPADGAR